MSERLLAPRDVVDLSAEGVDRLLTDLERTVPRRPPVVSLAAGPARSAIVFGDSHGDWRSTEELVARFASAPETPLLLGLGDYIDRSPHDCPHGSAVNALFLLGVAARHPDRVFLLQGNHELSRRIGARPHTLPSELEALWGRSAARYQRLMGLLERGPLAAVTPSGAYLSHAGFPRKAVGPRWYDSVDPSDETTLLEMTWAECDVSTSRRGAIAPWTEEDLERFLAGTGLAVIVRGHDPDLTGRPRYDGRVLTLHTCRIYERFGGVLFATLPLEGRLRSVDEITIDHLSTEGRRFPTVPDGLPHDR